LPARKTCSELGYRDHAPLAARARGRPRAARGGGQKVLRDCALRPSTCDHPDPLDQFGGIARVVARVLEVALHKAARSRLRAGRHRRWQRDGASLPARDMIEAMGQ
jgi:hypothetical protein